MCVGGEGEGKEGAGRNRFLCQVELLRESSSLGFIKDTGENGRIQPRGEL